MGVKVFVNGPISPGQLGAIVNSVKAGKPAASGEQAPFECYWGNPYQDANGVWRCPDGGDIPPGPPNPDDSNGGAGPSNGGIKSPPQTISNVKPGNPNAAVDDDDNLIFGFKPTTLLIVAAVGAGLYFMSGGTTTTK
jgi:hypothetical protein